MASLYLLAFLYTPLGDDPIAGSILRFFLIPMIVATGLLMWQQARVTKLFRWREAARDVRLPAQRAGS